MLSGRGNNNNPRVGEKKINRSGVSCTKRTVINAFGLVVSQRGEEKLHNIIHPRALEPLITILLVGFCVARDVTRGARHSRTGDDFIYFFFIYPSWTIGKGLLKFSIDDFRRTTCRVYNSLHDIIDVFTSCASATIYYRLCRCDLWRVLRSSPLAPNRNIKNVWLSMLMRRDWLF